MSTTPATRFAAVIVSVLSKQQTTTLSAGDVRKGSVQKIEYFCNATKLTSTAKLSSISSSSGGTTLMMFIMQSRSLLFPRPRSIPFTLTYQLMEIAKIRRNPMKRKDSRLLRLTCSMLRSIVRTSWPSQCRSRCEERPQGNHHQAYTQALPGSIAGPWYRQIARHFCARRRRRDENPPPIVRLIPSGGASIHPKAWLH